MKKTLGGINALYPAPAGIIGAFVGGRPRFIDIAKVRPLLFKMNSAK